MACFNGGNFILGGLVLDRQDYVDFGLKLVDGCHDTYIETATHIGPEVFQWQDSKASLNATNNAGPPSDQADFYSRAGFWITAEYYDLRPEVVESYYYAWRATGDSKYQDWAWDAFLHINASCSVGNVGLDGINNVNDPTGGGYLNHQESFLFAELLKYSYLIQDGVSNSSVFHRALLTPPLLPRRTLPPLHILTLNPTGVGVPGLGRPRQHVGLQHRGAPREGCRHSHLRWHNNRWVGVGENLHRSRRSSVYSAFSDFRIMTIRSRSRSVTNSGNQRMVALIEHTITCGLFPSTQSSEQDSAQERYSFRDEFTK